MALNTKIFIKIWFREIKIRFGGLKNQVLAVFEHFYNEVSINSYKTS